MKKNFLMVAALLIAAMLMVVSCTQEVAPKNNGLVEAKLNVAYGRDLSVTGDTKQDGVSLTYKMMPAWNATGSEAIYGGTLNTGKTDYEFKDLPENGNLGYVTPGLWNIEVRASGYNVTNNVNGTAKTIFSGTASVYFNETTKAATVFLAPVSEGTNTVTFSFLMQDLSANMDSDYLLTFAIYDRIEREVRSGELEGSAETGSSSVKRYTEKDSIASLPGGFYRVNVSIYRKKSSPAQNELVGGTTKGFLVSGGASVTIGGNIEPSDYESVSIDAYYVDVNTAFKADNVMNGETDTGKDYGVSVNDTTNGGAKVTMGINDTTNNPPSYNPTVTGTDSYTKTYLWTAVSDGETTTHTTNAPSDVEFEFNSPGYKNISCTTVYSITGTSTGGTSDTYYFADTISTQIYVDPTNFKVKLDTSSTT